MACPYTLDEVRELLKAYKTAEMELVSGQAKSYRIGSREFEAIDLGFIQAQIKRLAGYETELTGTRRVKRMQRVMIRDL